MLKIEINRHLKIFERFHNFLLILILHFKHRRLQLLLLLNGIILYKTRLRYLAISVCIFIMFIQFLLLFIKHLRST